jgi:dGTPase
MRPNAFYQPFDCEPLPGNRPSDYRSAFQIDRDRVIHSSAFRRLQAKTQVFLSGEYDFYRTRLTHSIEVAQIGRSICSYLRSRGDPLNDEFFIDPDLVEAVCLAHDLGHPPFGHAGERKLHNLMRPHGGFEGNAQTLQILTESIYQTGAGFAGMSPTRAFVDGVLKYKTLFSEQPQAENHFLYDEQARYRDFALGGQTAALAAGDPVRLNHFKSIECQVMDWADDVAYSLNDVVDGVRAGFLTFDKIERWAAGRALNEREMRLIDDLEEVIVADRLEAAFNRKIGLFLRACHLEAAPSGPLATCSNRHAFNLAVDPEVETEVRFYKAMAVDIIFKSPQLQQMEFKGGQVLGTLYEAFCEHALGQAERPLGILPPLIAKLIAAEPTERGKRRRVCDHLASMTDGQIGRTYRRLFDPDYGSIVDLG